MTASLLTYLLSMSTNGSSSGDVLHVLWMAPEEPVFSEGRRPVLSAATSVGSLALAVERVERERLLGDKQIK